MIEQLQQQITTSAIETMKGALVRFAKKEECQAIDSQLTIQLTENGLKYGYMKGYTPVKEISFNEILGVKFDLKQRELLTAPFLQKSILRLADETGNNPTDISVVIMTKDINADNIYMLAYNKNELIKQITLAWMFDKPEEVLGEIL